MAELENKQAHIHKLNSDDAAKRIRIKEEKEAHLAELKRAGEFEELNKAQEARLQELSQYESDALAYRAGQEIKKAEIATARESLDPMWHSTLDNLASVDAQANFLANITAQQAPPPDPKKKPIPAGAPAASGGFDLSTATEAEIKALRETNPDALKAAVRQRMGIKETKSSLISFFNGSKK